MKFAVSEVEQAQQGYLENGLPSGLSLLQREPRGQSVMAYSKPVQLIPFPHFPKCWNVVFINKNLNGVTSLSQPSFESVWVFYSFNFPPLDLLVSFIVYQCTFVLMNHCGIVHVWFGVSYHIVFIAYLLVLFSVHVQLFCSNPSPSKKILMHILAAN